MGSVRTGIMVVGLVTLAVIAVIVIEQSLPVPPQPQPQQEQQPPPAPPETQARASSADYEVVREYPHDQDAFTQGLIYLNGFLYESTGRTGRSTVRKVRLETGEVVQQRAVERRDYGEGLTEWQGKLVQLTPRRRGSAPIWDLPTFFEDASQHLKGENFGWTYDLASFELRSRFKYKGEGWGLTHDGSRLIMSDGSSKLRFVNPETFAELGGLEVSDGDKPVPLLNELEFIDGKIYANVWRQDRIAIIQPDSGHVTEWIELAGLKSRMPPLPDESMQPVLNGIAYDADKRRVFVTGKLWPKLFEIRLRPR